MRWEDNPMILPNLNVLAQQRYHNEKPLSLKPELNEKS